MFYKEWIFVRRFVFWFAVLVPASWFLFVAVVALTGSKSDFALTSWKQLLSWPVTLGAVAATIFGSGLARENDGHLEIAATKPISRFRFALGMLSVDVVGVAAVFAIALVSAYAALSVLDGHPLNLPAGADAWQIARYCAAPLAWFGLMVALTARMRCQGAGIVCGLAWPAGILLAVLAALPLLPAWHNAFAFINQFNPIAASAIVQIDVAASGSNAAIAQAASAIGLNLAVLALLAIGGPLSAALQWRRVEA